MPESSATAAVPLLFLVADTGGGHRAAARAVAGSLHQACPGRFDPVLLDPLGGPGSAWLLRCMVGLYGPVVRYAPWLWGVAYRATNSRLAVGVLGRTVLLLAGGPVRAAAAARPPAAVVSFHALATGAAVRLARSGPARIPVVTVVTDLGVPHAAWWHGQPDWLVVPPGAARPGRPGPRDRQGGCDGQAGRHRAAAGTAGKATQADSGSTVAAGEPARVAGSAAGTRYAEIGLPVAAGFGAGPLTAAQRASLRRALGADGEGFLVVVTGGAEGAGHLCRSARALLRGFGDLSVVVICGRNQRAQRALGRLARKAGGRLTVLGHVSTMADWLRCADLVVTKAGPGTIAEAACCGAVMLITSRLPGQEAGNAGLVVRAGAGRYTPSTASLVREVGRLRADPAALAAMRAASARFGRPGAASAIASLIARLAGRGQPERTAS